MRWASPWWLIALALVPLILWRYGARRSRATVRFASPMQIAEAGGQWATRLSWLPAALRALAVAAVVLALARPQKGDEKSRVFNEGIAIQMVVDVSSSMLTPDFESRGRRATRIDAVKEVFREFVLGDGELEGRRNDLIGMVAFARYADSVCPLTFDHDNLVRILEGTNAVRPNTQEDGTAIGDGIALGVERLRGLADRRASETRRDIKSKVMILLTDGEQTVPESMDPVEAAQLAAAFDIKIYTIGAGSTDTGGMMGFFQRASPIDEETLEAVADATGGKYFRATDSQSLRKIYEEIDRLEKTETEEVRYMQYAELAPPFLLAALALVGFEVLLVNTRMRQIP